MRHAYQALGRLKSGEMNKTESAYAKHLETLKRVGDVLWYEFEGITLRLAKRTSLTPDFFVMRSTGQLECHEVKGFWTDDARAKTKIAADKFPFRFLIVKAKRGDWEVEEL